MPLSPWSSLYGRGKKPSRRKLAQRIDALKLACRQCHVLPDPRRHTASEWPAVVARMEKNMEWMNRVVGNRDEPDF
jgi:hypothetical protein